MFSRIVFPAIIVLIVGIILMGVSSLNRVANLEPCPEGQIHVYAKNGIYCVVGSPAK